MDIETLLTGSKWEIIGILAKTSSSPLELAKKLNTTIANISQQLRLLQAAGLIKKQRTSEVKPGKPRMMFSLADDFCFMIIFSKNIAKKKLLHLDAKKKSVLEEWTKD
jgi:predicted transcriptional regulator